MTLEEQIHHRQAERTRTLTIAVAMGVSSWHKGTAQMVVPAYAYERGLLKTAEPTVAHLARAMGVNRSNLWACLGHYRGHRRQNLREAMEDFLGLVPGGMSQVLKVVEKLK